MQPVTQLSPPAVEFLRRAGWETADCAPLTGDASLRRYYRLRKGAQSVVLMDASKIRECVPPFFQVGTHLRRLGFSAPEIFEWDKANGLMLLEDFGDETFTRLLENASEEDRLYTLATELLAALHQRPDAVPDGMREYHSAKMLDDIELFLEWRTPHIPEHGKLEFKKCWGTVLPRAHKVPASLLLRDYHVANLMLLPNRPGIQQVGLLDFQDAYRGPISYDLVSLLQDARRDVSTPLSQNMISLYLTHFPGLPRDAFELSFAILAAQRHTRVLGIFERLSRREGKHQYKEEHSPRVQRMLKAALEHPVLSEVKRWFDRYAT